MERHRTVGSDVVKTGVVQSVEHFIQAVQLERRCERDEAVLEAVKLLDGIAQILREEGRTHGEEAQKSS